MNYEAAIGFLRQALDPTPVPKVLVVEDDTDDMEVLVKSLQKFNCTVVVAKTGEQAIKEITEDGIDLIFLDLKLPMTPGVEVLETARGLLPQAQIVVVSGYPDSITHSQAIKKGAILALPKPLTEELLSSILHRKTGTPPAT